MHHDMLTYDSTKAHVPTWEGIHHDMLTYDGTKAHVPTWDGTNAYLVTWEGGDELLFLFVVERGETGVTGREPPADESHTTPGEPERPPRGDALVLRGGGAGGKALLSSAPFMLPSRSFGTWEDEEGEARGELSPLSSPETD